MQWDRKSNSVTIPFLGWTLSDFEKNAALIDQWTAHELTHGIWERIAKDNDDSHGKDWRFWNEGFSHYVADIHMRPHYPSDLELCNDWSAFRIDGREAVSKVVEKQGQDALRTLPVRWRVFEAGRAGEKIIDAV